MSKHFRWAYNTAGRAGQPRELEIASATAIEKGEVVKVTSGLIVAIGDTDQDDPVKGVAAEDHDGSTSGRQSGTKIKVHDDPNDVFAYTPRIVCTATGGSTTTFVDSNLQFANDDDLNGGFLHIVSCAADSTLNGKIVKISDYTASTGTVTLAETLSATLAASDTAYICPGPIARGSHNWNLNSDGTDVSWEDSSAGEALELFDVDPNTFTVFFKFRLHLNGNYPIAV
jgi:hypothetical protein